MPGITPRAFALLHGTNLRLSTSTSLRPGMGRAGMGRALARGWLQRSRCLHPEGKGGNETLCEAQHLLAKLGHLSWFASSSPSRPAFELQTNDARAPRCLGDDNSPRSKFVRVWGRAQAAAAPTPPSLSRLHLHLGSSSFSTHATRAAQATEVPEVSPGTWGCRATSVQADECHVLGPRLQRDSKRLGEAERSRFPPSLAGTGAARPPCGFHSYFTNQKQKVNGAALTTYFPGALGDQLSASRLTHTLFIQSFKYPIVSVFSTLIFSILMIRSPALALFGLASVRGFFFFSFFFSPPF